jgi:alkylhydroperoxidase family enzyme
VSDTLGHVPDARLASDRGLDWLADAGLQPVVFDHLADLEAAIWSVGGFDPVLLELVRLRIAQLVQAPAELARRTPEAVAAGLDEATVAELSSWPTSPRFDDRDRAVLAWTEQWVIDPSEMRDDDAARLTAALTESECATLSTALALFEALTRTRVALGLA